MAWRVRVRRGKSCRGKAWHGEAGVPSADLKSSRQGRHHELMAGILNDLVTLPIGSAIQIPLNEVGGLSVAKLRSAVMRATAKKGISIESSSDKKNFYIWKSKAK